MAWVVWLQLKKTQMRAHSRRTIVIQATIDPVHHLQDAGLQIKF